MKKLSRRGFMKNSSLAAVGAAVALPGQDALKKKNIFVHHVYFWLKNPDSATDKAKLIQVPGIKLAHIGAPAATNRSVVDRSYAVSWLLFFNNLEDEEKYQKHPDHLKFVEEYAHLWEKVVVYDSEGKKY
jgi:hypothetical protein